MIVRRGIPADLLDVRNEALGDVAGAPRLRVAPRQLRQLVELLDAVPRDPGQKLSPLDVSSYAMSRRRPLEPSGDADALIPAA